VKYEKCYLKYVKSMLNVGVRVKKMGRKRRVRMMINKKKYDANL
jgi:hypothetical protein